MQQRMRGAGYDNDDDDDELMPVDTTSPELTMLCLDDMKLEMTLSVLSFRGLMPTSRLRSLRPQLPFEQNRISLLSDGG